MTITNVADLSLAIVAAGVAVTGVNGNGLVTPPSLQTAAQATIDAFDDSASAQATRQALRDRVSLDGMLSNGGLTGKLCRAVVLVTLDEFNAHSTWEAALAAAVAAATSLANLQTRVAAITPIPQRTKAQLLAAMQAKIDAGAVDS